MLDGFGAFLVFLSAIVAAVTAERWQATRYRAEQLLAATRPVLESCRQMLGALEGVRIILAAHMIQGHLWAFQRSEFTELRREIRGRAVELPVALSSMRILAPEITDRSTKAIAAIRAVRQAVSTIAGFIPTANPALAAQGAVTPLIVTGHTLPSIVAEIDRAEGLMAEALDELVGQTGIYHNTLLRFRFGVPLVAALAFLIGALVLWQGAWTSVVQDDRVIWTHPICRQVIEVPLGRRPSESVVAPTDQRLHGYNSAVPRIPSRSSAAAESATSAAPVLSTQPQAPAAQPTEPRTQPPGTRPPG